MTGKMGLVRNLTAGEILGQVFFARETARKYEMVSVSFDYRYIAYVDVGKLVGRMVRSSIFSLSCQCQE